MGQLRTLGVAGDSTLTWEPTEADQVAKAERRVAELRRRGFSFFVADPTAPGQERRIDSFEASAPRIIAVPPLVGG